VAVIPAIAGDHRFFVGSGPQTLASVAAAAGGEVPPAAEQILLDGVAPLQTAGPAQVSFIDNRRYLGALAQTRAGAVIVAPALAAKVPAGAVPIVTDQPYLGWARVAALFYPEPPVVPATHPLAVIDPTARLGEGLEIGPFVVIGAGAEIGEGCRIAAHAVIGPGVVLGAGCRVGSQVSISHALIGARVRLFPGVRIGQDGFGFAVGPAGFVSVPQLGRVVIGDDVEIGANSTIDRGSAQDTVIGAGTRIDNLVMIGHNVRVGRNCVIVAQVGIAGSVEIGDGVVIGGQAGFVGHVRVGDRARIGAQAGVMGDVEAGAEIVGSPAAPARTVLREIAWVRRAVRQARGDAGRADKGVQGGADEA
jgi:UDP-3-O-[3-hydroxymyristoyl] glucosamine N-acyltransferase